MKKFKIISSTAIFFIIIFSVGLSYTKTDNQSQGKIPGFFKHSKPFKRHPNFPGRIQPFAQDRILVKFKPMVSEQSINSAIHAYQSRTIRKIPQLEIHVLEVPKNSTVEEMIYNLGLNPDVEYVGPDYKTRITITPNDTLFQYQYALNNEGQAIGVPGSPQGKARADIKAPSGWEETKGSEEILIAIIDTGVELNHPDLINKIYSSGRDFVEDDFVAEDDHGHGTHVAGIAAADTNNNEGIAGVAWNCMILPIKAIDESGEGYYSWMIDGIQWAVDEGASVINLSLGGDEEDPLLEAALKFAYDQDVVVVASAGNDSMPVLYPAAYDEYCLAVAASDYNDIRPEWSNFGPEVDVAAPGDRVLSCVPTWLWEPEFLPYGYGTGTSQAAPHVAGLAALIKSFKDWLSADDIMKIIRYTSDDINASEFSGKDDFIGYGRINIEKALVPIKITEIE